MKRKIAAIMTVITVLALMFSMSSCGGKHEHKFEWEQNEHEHWRICVNPGCDGDFDKQQGEHEGYPCDVCDIAFNAVAFYTGINDQAHVSFVNEANTWFAETAKKSNFAFTATDDWTKLNDDYLESVDLVMFLDTRPEDPEQRAAFQRFMERGGAWIGFHFSAFTMANSAYEPDWDWYHDEFLGSGEYVSNTWEPTTAKLKVETHEHCATKNLPDLFESTACEWYRWEFDLRENPDITILASIDESSFPLGTKPPEVWNSGYYPVVWSNNNYNMLYMNMGHNRVTYGNNSQDLSHTFDDETQNRMLMDAMFGLTRKHK